MPMTGKLVSSRVRAARKRTAARAHTRTRVNRASEDVAVIERIVAGLAHDIRTPLTGILAASELLARSNLGERERRWVATLKSSAEHLNSLTALVVDAARMRAGKLTLQHTPFDPREVALAAAASLSARAEGAGLECEIAITRELPAAVVGDAVRLRTALENLIDNAVKFTQRGKVAFSVECRKRARGYQLDFAVSDSGIGLSAAEIKRLFRPFSQAHSGIAERYGGAGLGLSLVQRLARAMGGDLTVTSKPGQGSTFCLSVEVSVA
jgi:signal transduction histidine kinase